jgi:hypothetical protein
MRLLRHLKLIPWTTLSDDTAEASAYPLIKRIHSGDFGNAEKLLRQSPDENRERLVYGYTLSPDALARARDWATRQTSSAFAHVVLGATLITEAWDIRGGAYADDVDDKRWAPFAAKLQEARAALARATELDDYFADAHAWLIHVGLGLGESPDQMQDWFDAALAREPLHWGTHYKYFLSTTEKWGGSHKAMFAFARSSAKKGGKRSLLNALLPMAYAELALAEASRKHAKAAAAKLCQPQYAQELSNALYRWLGCTQEQLEALLLDVGGPFRRHVLNHFGASLYLTGARHEARAVFKALNGQIEAQPWAWIAKGPRERLAPGFVFDRACREIGVPL